MDDLTFRELLDAIAAKSPTPGGGAVAAITAALAAALTQMVINYSLGKKSLAAHDASHQAAMQRLQQMVHTSLQLAQDDADAYARMNELWRLNESDERRRREMPAAVEGAIEPPRKMLNASVETLQLLRGLVGITNTNLKSDLAIAATLAEAAARAAAWNVSINLPMVIDSEKRQHLEELVTSQLDEARRVAIEIEKACGAPA